ncbi:hypothetical protein, partial [Dokdonella sp.]|uniref:DUF7933 domain-containing protein n=1 Tax=Dokdonella sp. TaxID=2291710 RepID=UPI00261EE3EE
MKMLSLSFAGLLLAGSAGAASLQRAPASNVARIPAAALGARALAQMDDHTPVALGGVACSDYQNARTFGQSWWRRFYLAEHGSPSSLRIESVTIGAEAGIGPVTIRLHALPHAIPVDTIPAHLLRPLGQSDMIMVHGQLNTTTIPVTGLLADAVGEDLVVEYHVGETFNSAFYAGANATTETHPSFLSAPGCDVPEPTRVADLGFPDAHMILVANIAAPGVGALPSFTPATIASGEVSRLQIVLANPLTSPAALTSAFTIALPPGLFVAPLPNAATTCGGSVTAAAMQGSVSLDGAAIAAQGSCTFGVDVTSLGGVFELAIPAGALRTNQGDSTQPSSASLTVVPAGGNGLIRSGPLDRLLAPSMTGTSYDMIRHAFSDTGQLGGDWDLRFGLSQDMNSPVGIVLGLAAPASTEFLLDGSGRIALLRDGDVVGPTSTFVGNGVSLDPALYAGVDGAIGVRFRCAGRLTYPVAGGDDCYGYMRVATTAPSGLPARLIESVFQGDGEPVTVELEPVTQPPAASLSPTSISLSVAANAVSYQEVKLANAAGSAPLRYATSGQGVALAALPAPQDRARPSGAATEATEWLRPPMRLPDLRRAEVFGFDPTPWSTTGGFRYVVDDGVHETIMGIAGQAGIWLNRFSVIEAQTIDSMSVFWPEQLEGGSLLGLTANLVAYYDADGDGDPRNAVRLGGDTLVTIDAIGRFLTYPTQFAVPGAGDVYIGVVEHWAMNGYPFELAAIAVDATTYRAVSFVSLNFPDPATPPNLNLDDLGANQFTAPTGALGIPATFLFRATGTGVSCSGAAVPWLGIEGGNTDVVVGGAAATLNFRVDPAAGQLDPGTHHAELCIVTNDPVHRTLSLPVTVQVTAPAMAHACAGNGDNLFCDGFDRGQGEAIVRSGLLDVELPP